MTGRIWAIALNTFQDLFLRQVTGMERPASGNAQDRP